jgi:hypothetical protein
MLSHYAEGERLFSEEDLGQGWQTFLRVLARIVRKLRRNLFASQREFWRVLGVLHTLLLITALLLVMHIIMI